MGSVFHWAVNDLALMKITRLSKTRRNIAKLKCFLFISVNLLYRIRSIRKTKGINKIAQDICLEKFSRVKSIQIKMPVKKINIA
jgi:hypothetical protein